MPRGPRGKFSIDFFSPVLPNVLIRWRVDLITLDCTFANIMLWHCKLYVCSGKVEANPENSVRINLVLEFEENFKKPFAIKL